MSRAKKMSAMSLKIRQISNVVEDIFIDNLVKNAYAAEGGHLESNDKEADAGGSRSSV
jgi:hypothetical protein